MAINIRALSQCFHKVPQGYSCCSEHQLSILYLISDTFSDGLDWWVMMEAVLWAVVIIFVVI